ncbi:MAG: nitroreductase family protein [Muricomes sp.]
MTILEAIKERHSVRDYTDKKIPTDIVTQLQSEISDCNKESGLNIQIVTEEPKAFDSFMAHYGKFSGVKNYIALIGKKSSDLDEKLGYYGERVALFAQSLGLHTCWVAMTFSKGVTKSRCEIKNDEKLVCVLALGYGKTQGVGHKSKSMSDVCTVNSEMPKWFEDGMEAALLAPTAMNQQKFLFSLDGNCVSAKATGGFYSKIDLGIVKYHFEIGAGAGNFTWQNKIV